jgi:hypothetical protein
LGFFFVATAFNYCCSWRDEARLKAQALLVLA